MLTKEQVIAEIRRIADETGKPPGIQRFEALTGIGRRAIVGPLWRTWSAAVSAAGFAPNTLVPATDKDCLLRLLAEEARALGKFPSDNDLRFANKNKEDFPSTSTFTVRLGHKEDRVNALREWIEHNPEFDDVLEMIAGIENSGKSEYQLPKTISRVVTGHVYLYKGRSLYYIGQTKDLDRRKSDHKRYQEGKLTFLHVIETDDPKGIEGYWHERFKAKNDHGDWFHLDAEDIAAFKRRKYQ